MTKISSTPYTGYTKIGTQEIPCAVLNPNSRNPVRVFVQNDIVGLLTGNKKARLKKYLQPKNLKPFLPSKFKNGMENSVIKFKLNNKIADGIIGNDIIDIGKMYNGARRAGALHHSQEQFAYMAEVLMFAFAKTGVDAIIDEATGYQDIRVKNSIERVLAKMLPAYTKQYTVSPPLELYKLWFKLNHWEWRPENVQKKPSILAKWTCDLIYNRIDPNLLVRLMHPSTSKGISRKENVQLLLNYDSGSPEMCDFFGGLTALGRATSSWRKYYSMVNRAFPKFNEVMPADDLNSHQQAAGLLSFY